MVDDCRGVLYTFHFGFVISLSGTGGFILYVENRVPFLPPTSDGSCPFLVILRLVDVIGFIYITLSQFELSHIGMFGYELIYCMLMGKLTI